MAALVPARASAADLSLGYGGRATDPTGAPLPGPLDLEVRFYRAAKGGEPLLQAPLTFPATPLKQGVFQLSLTLTAEQAATVFGDGTPAVWVEVTNATKKQTYPRQQFLAVPYAARVPVDGATVTYDTTGHLTLVNPPGTSPGSLVQLDSSSRLPALDGSRLTSVAATTFTAPLAGDVTGSQAATVVSSIQGAPVQATGASPGDFLKWNGSKWVPGSVVGAAGGTVTSIATTSPLTLTGDPTTAPTLGIDQAGAGSDGYLSQADWTAFNAKQAAITASSTVDAGTVTSALQKGFDLKPYGAGAGQTGELRFEALSGGNYVGLKAPDAVASSKVWMLPAADGSAGQLLKTDGAGRLGWVAGAAPTGAATGDLSGTYPAPTVATVGGVTAANVASGAAAANAAVSTNTVSTLVKRDASGNFSAGTITASLAGNVTGNVTGNLTGNVTGNVSGSAASFTGSLVGDVTGTQGATAVAKVGGVTAANVASGANAANAATAANTASTIVARDGSGNFSAGTITATLNGNATNVTGIVDLDHGGTGANLAATGGAGQFLKQTSSGAAVSVAGILAADLPTMVGATAGAAGTQGAVPPPAAGQQGLYLKGDGTWGVPSGTAAGTTGQIQFNGGGALTASSSLFWDQATGRLGIGTTTPGARLQINTGSDAAIGSVVRGNSATQSGDLTEWQSSAGAVLAKVDAAGHATFASITGTVNGSQVTGTLASNVVVNANQVSTGTLAASVFPATLPAVSGASLTSLNASQLTSGTLPNGVFPATLPAVSGANLTSLDAGHVTTGVLSVGNGGTGVSSLPLNGVLFGNGASTPLSTAAPSAQSQVLTAGSGNTPTWGTLNLASSSAVGTSVLGYANGGTGLSAAPANGALLVGTGSAWSTSSLAAGLGLTLNQSAGVITLAATADPATKVSKTGDSMTGTLAVNGFVDVTGSIRMADGNQAAGQIMTSDATGKGSWATPAYFGQQCAPGTYVTGFDTSGNILCALPYASFADISDGGVLSCSLMSDTRIKCWGSNAQGELGDNTTTNHSTPKDVYFPDGSVVVGALQVASGGHFACALINDGTVDCWGYNVYGAIGDGTLVNKTTATPVTGLTGQVTQISAGTYHACAVMADSTVQCWGWNASHQIGDATTTNRTAATTVLASAGVNLTNVVQVAAGSGTTCALKADGTVWCWGDNTYGQVGNGTSGATDATYPTEVLVAPAGAAFTGVTQIAASRGWYYNGSATVYNDEHMCAVKSDGTAWCWGYNGQGQLGNNTATTSTVPVQVKTGAATFLTNVSRISAGPMHTCAIAGAGGNAYCWGYGANYWNGTNATTNSSVAIQVHGPKNVGLLSGVTRISVSGYSPYGFASVVTTSGTLYAWGYNGWGNLGDGTVATRGYPWPVLYP